MKLLKIYIACMCFLLTFRSMAQISPGKLTDAHKELEGIMSCTKCHDMGESVSTAKCLECHDEIQALLDAGRGFHASKEAVDKECIECHSEHHGRKFDMMRLDEDNFDHDLTGYVLEGQHDVIECKECHQAEFILDEEIRKRSGTFLGLTEDCKTCHDDFHQGTLAEDCLSCHDFEAFRPAPGFDHDETDYPLRGGHVDVDCLECHPMTTLNGKEFQEFSDIAFNDCIACHEDPHQSQLQGECMQCHEVAAFESFIGDTGFDHNQTQFELRGSHQQVACFECHEATSEPLQVFQDHQSISQNDCISCHEDVHEGKFGNDCAECHNEESWFALGDLSDFDHDMTDYPLEGKHIPVDCKECHTTEKYTDPIDFSNCANCHDDFHEGEFAVDGISPDCADCHSVLAGFEETTFTVERHEETDFPLEGAHIATPCFACHLSEEEEWAFVDIDSDCVDCHEDIHQGQFVVEGVNDCARCHDTETWFPELFDHDATLFVLEGRHAEVDCDACHKPLEADGESYIEYKIKNFQCVDCHQ